MKTIFIFAITSLPLVLGPGQPQGEKVSPVAAEEYAVYSALLDGIKESPNDGKAVNLFVVDDKTSGVPKMCMPDEIAKWEKEIKADELQPLVEDLLAKNKESYSLGRHFAVTRSYLLLSADDFSDIFRKKDLGGEWDDFYKKYPNSSGYIIFSRVGFNADMTKAILYSETRCGILCAYGGYVFLERNNGKWNVTGGFLCWQS